MNQRSGPQAQRGFTLLEMIVVVLVFSIMAVMAYGGLSSVLRSREALQNTLERTQALQKAFTRLRGDFQNLRDRPVRDGFGDLQPALRTTREGIVEFTRGGWRNPLFLPRSSMERVAYAYDEKNKQLKRLSWRVLDRADDTEPASIVVLERVDEAAWRFLDGQGQWSEEWPSSAAVSNAQANAASNNGIPPPRAVELQLKTADWGELRFLFMAGADEVSERNLNLAGPPSSQPPADGGDEGDGADEP